MKKQPKPKKGYKFTGWAVFNWGISHDRVFRTRKEAHEYCWKNERGKKNGRLAIATCWNDVKDHMAVVKVKVSVL